jgi:DNA-binding MarR family transcriptional regulator
MAADPSEAGNVLLQVFRTGQAVGQLLRHALAGTGVSPDEWAVVSVVGLLGPLAPSALADHLRVPPTSISRHVARLVDAGLVRRVAHPQDGRSYLIELTSAGRAEVETIAPRFRSLVGDLRGRAPVDEIEVALVQLERAAKELDLDRSATER